MHVHEPPCFSPTYISHTSHIHIYIYTHKPPNPNPDPPNPTNPQENSFHSPGRWMEYQINSPILPPPPPSQTWHCLFVFSNIYLFIFPGVGSLPITSGIGGLGGGGGFWCGPDPDPRYYLRFFLFCIWVCGFSIWYLVGLLLQFEISMRVILPIYLSICLSTRWVLLHGMT